MRGGEEGKKGGGKEERRKEEEELATPTEPLHTTVATCPRSAPTSVRNALTSNSPLLVESMSPHASIYLLEAVVYEQVCNHSLVSKQFQLHIPLARRDS